MGRAKTLKWQVGLGRDLVRGLPASGQTLSSFRYYGARSKEKEEKRRRRRRRRRGRRRRR